jgi:hypothetical protein
VAEDGQWQGADRKWIKMIIIIGEHKLRIIHTVRGMTSQDMCEKSEAGLGGMRTGFN